MPPDPDAPSRLPDLVEAFAQTAQAVADLARTCTDEDLAKPTECPGWSVHDQISHVAGVEAWLQGNKDPRVEMPPYEHIRNDLGKRIEYAVELRRGRTGGEVRNELDTVLAERLLALRDPGLTDSDTIPGPFGPDQAVTVLLLRTFDVWTHEQDIRSALGRPGDLDSPAAGVFVAAVMRQVPKLIAKRAGLEPGYTVVIEVNGPTAARQGVRVEVDEQGRLRGRPISGDAVSSDAVSSDAVSSEVTISLSTEAFTRRAAGRRSVSDTPHDVVGDEATARRILEALVVTH